MKKILSVAIVIALAFSLTLFVVRKNDSRSSDPVNATISEFARNAESKSIRPCIISGVTIVGYDAEKGTLLLKPYGGKVTVEDYGHDPDGSGKTEIVETDEVFSIKTIYAKNNKALDMYRLSNLGVYIRNWDWRGNLNSPNYPMSLDDVISTGNRVVVSVGLEGWGGAPSLKFPDVEIDQRDSAEAIAWINRQKNM